MRIKSFELNKFLQFCICQKQWRVNWKFWFKPKLWICQNIALSKKATYSHNSIASLSMSVITYCHQKNPLRVRTKPYIRLCYAWSSQRFKSLPSILCEIVVCAKPVTCRKPVILSKTPYRPAIWTEVAGRSRLLETWSPCSHPFAILPVSAVSDAQKLATGNFLHVRAAAFWFFLQKQKE